MLSSLLLLLLFLLLVLRFLRNWAEEKPPRDLLLVPGKEAEGIHVFIASAAALARWWLRIAVGLEAVQVLTNPHA